MPFFKSKDTLVGSIAATIAGAVMMRANMAQWMAIFGVGGSDGKEGGKALDGTYV